VKSDEGPGYLALLALALIWGYTWIVIKVATSSADPFTVAALRSGIGAVCLFVALLATRRSLRPPPFLPTLAFGLLQTTGFTLFQTAAVATGGTGKAAILVYTMPFWTVLFAFVFLRDRIGASGWCALALAAIGLGFVVWPLDVAHGLASKAYAIVGGASWAGSIIVLKRLRARHTIEVVNLTAWQMVYGSVPLVVVALAYPHHRLVPTTPFVLALAYLAIVGTALAWIVWAFALSRLAAAAAGIGSLITPVTVVLMAWGFLGERPDPVEVTGIVIILAALVANAAPMLRKPAPA
jgi:drug/metabolite transporter (DMT)-like permease